MKRDAWIPFAAASISPYLFYWQSSLEVEEEKASSHRKIADRRGASLEQLMDRRIDVATGAFASNVVMDWGRSPASPLREFKLTVAADANKDRAIDNRHILHPVSSSAATWEHHRASIRLGCGAAGLRPGFLPGIDP